MVGEWQFEMRHHASSAIGAQKLTAFTVSLVAEKDENTDNIVLIDQPKRRTRFRLEMKTPTSGVLLASVLRLPQPSENVNVPSFSLHGLESESDLDEFDEVSSAVRNSFHTS